MGSQYKWLIDWIFYWKCYRLMIAIVICIALSAIADNHRIYGSTIKRIAVLPFKINAAKDLSFLKVGIYDMFIRMQFPIDPNAIRKRLYSGCLVFWVLLLTASPAFSGDAELTNLTVRNTIDDLQVDLTIKGIFTEEMKAAVSKGIPISLTFLILLYEVRDYWFDNKMASKTAVHDIKFDVLKKEYRLRRSWEKGIPLVIKDFEKAQSLFSEIKEFDVIPLKRLKKGQHYQLRIKSELSENKAHLTGLPWQFETDWYALNFIY